MLLNIEKSNNNCIKLSYVEENERSRRRLKKKYLRQFPDVEEHDKNIRCLMELDYYQYFKYPAEDLLFNLKALSTLYKQYIVVDYEFQGVSFDNNRQTTKCIKLCPKYSEMEINVLGKDYFTFYNVLKYNGRDFGDCLPTMVRKFHIELMPLNQVIKTIKPRKRTHIPRGLRHEVFKRDNYTCQECGAKKSEGATLHIDHIKPIAKGGTDELSNLQTLCKECNLNKNDVYQKIGE